MLYILLMFMALFALRIRFVKFNDGYLDRDQTTCVKGILAIIILCSHSRNYVNLYSLTDKIFGLFLNSFGQLMVAMFLFYSGYGVMAAFNKSADYASTFPKKRILKILIHYDLAVLLYLVLSLVTRTVYPSQNYIFAWIALKSIGQATWFVFDILILYLLAYAAMLIANKYEKKSYVCHLVAALVAVMWIIMYVSKVDSWWYNTILCFPLGMYFFRYKPEIDNALKKNNMVYAAVLVFVSALFLLTYNISHVLSYSICSCLFSVFVLLVMMKLKLSANKLWLWLGNISFEIYILHSLFMKIFKWLNLNQNNFVFLGITIISTLVFAHCFNKLLKITDNKLYSA